VNPDHLFVGSHRDNMDDMKAKCRQARGVRHPDAKMRPADVVGIFALAARGYSDEELGALFGVTGMNIRAVLTRRTWRHVEAPDDLVAKVAELRGWEHTA